MQPLLLVVWSGTEPDTLAVNEALLDPPKVGAVHAGGADMVIVNVVPLLG